MGFLVTASDSDVATTSGTSRFQLDCTFNETTHAVSSLNGIKFLYGDGASDPGPLDFDDVSFTLNYVLSDNPLGTLNVWSTNLAGSNSTGRQEDWPTNAGQDPDLIPFVPVNGSGQFLLDTRHDPGERHAALSEPRHVRYLRTALCTLGTWRLREAWNDGQTDAGQRDRERGNSEHCPAPWPPTTSTCRSRSSRRSPSGIPIPGGTPNPLGYVTATGTMVMSGQFTRTVEVHVPILGDANDDGVVDDKDASILGANWLQSGGSGRKATSTTTRSSTTRTPRSWPPIGAPRRKAPRFPSRRPSCCSWDLPWPVWPPGDAGRRNVAHQYLRVWPSGRRLSPTRRPFFARRRVARVARPVSSLSDASCRPAWASCRRERCVGRNARVRIRPGDCGTAPIDPPERTVPLAGDRRVPPGRRDAATIRISA